MDFTKLTAKHYSSAKSHHDILMQLVMSNYVTTLWRHNVYLKSLASSRVRQSQAKNLTLTVGNQVVLWNKIMKEVKLKRVAGPYDHIPFDNYIQSPIGLVPKAGGDQTRLIFHLSYDFGSQDQQKSVNYHTPRSLCSVKYCDIDHAVQAMLKLKLNAEQQQVKQKGSHNKSVRDYKPVVIYIGKTDIKSAFRLAPLKPECWAWTVMKALNPWTKKWQYFIDKCLPFGASISCAIFQRISDALKHIAQVRTRTDITNYLDDFLFIALTIMRCNFLLQQFLELCHELGFPIAEDKLNEPMRLSHSWEFCLMVENLH